MEKIAVFSWKTGAVRLEAGCDAHVSLTKESDTKSILQVDGQKLQLEWELYKVVCFGFGCSRVYYEYMDEVEEEKAHPTGWLWINGARTDGRMQTDALLKITRTADVNGTAVIVIEMDSPWLTREDEAPEF